ncbi:hypothetical protein SO802_017961 [Lithocarpus litseifolius]|uniref:Uncharacterized protein n=1 Tax=Lithocarpus litseifolius TaxID=425828 RepID=A0AAW2CLI2_9ROSI
MITPMLALSKVVNNAASKFFCISHHEGLSTSLLASLLVAGLAIGLPETPKDHQWLAAVPDQVENPALTLITSCSGRLQPPQRSLRGSGVGDKQTDSIESADEFERRIFGDFSGGNSKSDAFFEKLDRLGKARDTSGS